MSVAWQVLPHRPIQKPSPRVWRVEGDLPNMPLKRVMTVIRLSDGRLVIHNAIALEEAAMAEIERFGEVAFVIVPNAYHRIDAPRFAARYPGAKILCPPAAEAAVRKVCRVDGHLDALPPEPALDVMLVAGMGGKEGVLRIREDEGATLVFNDAIFNMPDVPGMQGWVLKNVTQSTGGPKLTRVARLFLLSDRRAFGEQLVELAATPALRRVIVSHHEMIERDPGGALSRIAASL